MRTVPGRARERLSVFEVDRQSHQGQQDHHGHGRSHDDGDDDSWGREDVRPSERALGLVTRVAAGEEALASAECAEIGPCGSSLPADRAWSLSYRTWQSGATQPGSHWH